jgi:type II secretory pathway pseudopilin PulG
MKKDQGGFGVIETLLVLVIVGILGVIGWYVVSSNHKTQKQLDTLSQSANSPAPSSKKADAPNKKFIFKELKVQITLPGDLKDLSYNKDTLSSAEIYDLNTPEFKQLAAKCGESAPAGFAIISSKEGKFTAAGNEGSNGLLKQFDTRYISYGDTLTGNPCDTSIYTQLVDMQTKLTASLKSSFQTATEVQ